MLWTNADRRYLHRKIQSKEGERHQYYAYVLEAVLILTRHDFTTDERVFGEQRGTGEVESDEKWKQDCELRPLPFVCTT